MAMRMKREAAHRHRRAAYLAMGRIIMIIESKPDKAAQAWAEMQLAAEQFEAPRDPRRDGLRMLLARPGNGVPACCGNGHVGVV
jgi:hypothetical protein